MNFKLDPLPYDSASLEPHIDQKTMEIHHGRHHNAYVTNLNKALEGNQAAANKSLEDLMKEISNFGAGVRNNGGGHYNHSLFWSILSGEPTKPSENLQKAIEAKLDRKSTRLNSSH